MLHQSVQKNLSSQPPKEQLSPSEKRQRPRSELEMKASSPNANRLDSLLGAIDMVPEKELEEDADMQSSDFQENVQLINPLNPIKDPVTKRRLKICANRFCGSKGYGNESNWSRRKFGKGQFVWLCKRCSEAYNND